MRAFLSFFLSLGFLSISYAQEPKIEAALISLNLGNDNFQAAIKNDDVGLTWSREEKFYILLKLDKLVEKIGLTYRNYGALLAVRKTGETILNQDSEEWDKYNYLDIYEQGEVRLKNEVNISKYLNELNVNLHFEKLQTSISLGNVFLDTDSNQRLAETRQNLHRAMDFYNVNYEDFSKTLEGYEENANYLYLKLTLSFPKTLSLADEQVSLGFTPSLSFQGNIPTQNKDLISKIQFSHEQKFNLGLLKPKFANSFFDSKFEIETRIKNEWGEILPEDLDPGHKHSLGFKIQYNMMLPKLKSNPASPRIYMGITPLEFTRALGKKAETPFIQSELPSGIKDNKLIGKLFTLTLGVGF